MLRKLIIAFTPTVAIGVAAIPTGATAAWHGHGGWHRGWGGPSWSYYGYRYAYGPGPYYNGCYRTIRVATSYGPRWRRAWVCG